mgnify:CR=1 FL=1
MRIISGYFKGKKISLPDDKHTRPLRDMVKESIFNLIEHSNKINLKIKDAFILDLFSGSGSFGLECISRGAKKVIFIENYFRAFKILNENIRHLNVEEKSKVINQDSFKFFNHNRSFDKKFKIIFMDPPYKEKKINYLIEKIKEKKILDKNGVIIIHRHKLDDVQISQKLKILDERKYGISKIIIGN